MKNIVWYVEATVVVPFDKLIVHDADGLVLDPVKEGWTPEETAAKLAAGEVGIEFSELGAYTEDAEHTGFSVEDEDEDFLVKVERYIGAK